MIMIDPMKLANSRYSDVRIVSHKYTKDKKQAIVVEFIERKIIYAENAEELKEQIEDELNYERIEQRYRDV